MRLAQFALPAALCLALLAGCGDDGHDHEHGPGDGHGAEQAGTESAHGHVHSAQHGGSLVILGEETAHLEFVLDRETGGLTCYVLGPHADAAVRIAQETIVVEVDTGGGSTRVDLKAVEDDLSGETAGDTSVFRGARDELKALERFSGTVRNVTVKGQLYDAVAFEYEKKDD